MSAELTASLPGDGHVHFTTRADGNMSSAGGDGAERGAANRERLRAQLGLRAIARGYQVHGSTVEIVHSPPARELPHEDLTRADGQATALSGLGAMVLAADCLPVALGAPGAVAMVHAGWRGLAEGVLEQSARAVRELAGAEGPLRAAIGPAAGGCCYEVGPEVLAALGLAAPGAASRVAVRSAPREGHALLDLRTVARERLLALGAERVEQVGGCTVCDERFFSHRREGSAAGRMAGVAWLS
ncbi:MAG: polyphenol oxidase family protein [Solirubrobacteraceae bacterium]